MGRRFFKFSQCILEGMKNRFSFWLITFLLVIIALFVLWPYFAGADLPDVSMTGFGSGTVRARVTEIIEDGEINLGDVLQRYQIARVELLEGEYQGIVMEMDYGKRQVLSSAVYLQTGDMVLVTVGSRPDGVLTVYFVDFVRANSLLWLTAIFVAAVLVISRWKGLRSLLSMAFSLMVIISYIIPHILAGEDPLIVSITGSVILLGVTLYLTYGWNLKTHAAVVSMIIVLLITGTLAGLFVIVARLTG